MLQSNNGEIRSQIPFTVVSAKPANDTFDAPCPVSAELMNLFEDITGWKIEFAESRASHHRRKMAEEQGAEQQGADDQAIIEGIFSIVDMSEKWPAQKPTCHRAKCDDLVSCLIHSTASFRQQNKICTKLDQHLPELRPKPSK